MQSTIAEMLTEMDELQSGGNNQENALCTPPFRRSAVGPAVTRQIPIAIPVFRLISGITLHPCLR